MKYLLITFFCVLSLNGYAHNAALKKSIIEVNTSILQKQINYIPIIDTDTINTKKSLNDKKEKRSKIIVAGIGLALIGVVAIIPGINIALSAVVIGLGCTFIFSALSDDDPNAEWEQNKQEQKRKRQLKKLSKESKASNR